MNLTKLFLARMLRNVDDGASGEGNPGDGGQPPAAEPLPPAPSQPSPEVTALQQQLSAMQQQLQTFQALAFTQQPRQAEPQQEPSLLDSELERVLGKRDKQLVGAVQQMVGAVADRVDRQALQQIAAETGVDPKVFSQVEQRYQAWQARGVPATREDALAFELGLGALDQQRKARATRAQAEAQRRAQNELGGVERPTGGRRVPAGVDPDRMSRQERLDKYYSAVLDDQGF